MSSALPSSTANLDPAWYCVRSQPRHEHIAAANLRKIGDIHVLNPRIRFRRATRRGPIWVIESMFPSYLFARFNLSRSLDMVQHTFGVATVVHFASFWPVVPDQTIRDFQSLVGEEEIRLVDPTIKIGEEVEIADGAFGGFHGIVTRVMPARDRVAVLLEFLGRQTTVELPLSGVMMDGTRYAVRGI